jgi:UDP-N-acetylmuramate-alanine ligase
MLPVDIDALVRDPKARIHFVGIGGTGMSAYADHRALSAGAVSGSDRTFDQGSMPEQRQSFLNRGIKIYPQDGSGVDHAAALVVSVTIEQQVPDYARAVELGVPIITRKEWLAAHYRVYPCIAITGTSGKSTVTAMVFDVLVAAGRNPGLIAGAELVSIGGNAAAGAGPLVLEADESDKGIADYTPEIGVILNLQRDHDEPAAILQAMKSFKDNARNIIISDDIALMSLRDGAMVYGETADARYRVTDVVVTPHGSSFMYDGTRVTLPVPGRHNVENAAAAFSVADALKIPRDVIVAALADFKGVVRRFQIVGAAKGIEVVDDYAHNPIKIAAVIRTAIARSKRVRLWFQPHGYGPMRFMREDLTKMFATELRGGDDLFFAPIFYAGGTVAADISSDMLVADIQTLGHNARVIPTRQEFMDLTKSTSQTGDCIVIVGGRDPTLSSFARDVAAAVL